MVSFEYCLGNTRITNRIIEVFYSIGHTAALESSVIFTWNASVNYFFKFTLYPLHEERQKFLWSVKIFRKALLWEKGENFIALIIRINWKQEINKNFINLIIKNLTFNDNFVLALNLSCSKSLKFLKKAFVGFLSGIFSPNRNDF